MSTPPVVRRYAPFFLCLALVQPSCARDQTAAPISAASVVLRTAADSVQRGQILGQFAVVKDARGNVLQGRPVTWSSSDTTVARVTSWAGATTADTAAALVTGISVGSALISAVVETARGAASVTVTAIPQVIRMSQQPISAHVDEAVEVTALVTDSSGHPAPRAVVSWTTFIADYSPYGGGINHPFWTRTIPPGATFTGNDGVARISFTPPKAGMHAVVATVGSAVTSQAAVSATFAPGTGVPLTWQNVAPMPIARQNVVAVTRGERIYLVGGWCVIVIDGVCDPPFRLGFTDTLFLIFTPATNAWSYGRAAPEHSNSRTQQRDVAANLPEGIHMIVDTHHYLYETERNRWIPAVSPPISATDGIMEAVQGKLYLVSSSGALAIFDGQYTWSTGARMPTARRNAASAVIDGRIYVAGGGEGNLDAIGSWPAGAPLERYDPAANAWTVLAPMPYGRQFIAGAALGNHFCVFGGGVLLYRTSEGFRETYCYDPAKNAWMLGPPSLASVGTGAAQFGDDVYAFGGASYNSSLFWLASTNAAKLSLHP